MVQLIVGKKGKGKTKQLLDKVNSEVKSITGNIAYLDKSMAHMYELNNKVRMIDVSKLSEEDIDVVVNCAGFGVFGQFSETDLKKETEMITIAQTATAKTETATKNLISIRLFFVLSNHILFGFELQK
mgnify:CR=1 FL=1